VHELPPVLCYSCWEEEIHPWNFECGHVVPHCVGGGVEASNLRPICKGCNTSMGDDELHYYIRANSLWVGKVDAPLVQTLRMGVDPIHCYPLCARTPELLARIVMLKNEIGFVETYVPPYEFGDPTELASTPGSDVPGRSWHATIHVSIVYAPSQDDIPSLHA
jgi:HNH endonuclease